MCCALVYLTLDASQTAATCFGFAETLAVAATVLPRDPQLMKLPLLFLVNLFHPCCFEQSISAFRCVRLQEGALVQVGSADVDVLLGDVVHRQLLGLGALLGTILSQLKTRTSIIAPMFGTHLHIAICTLEAELLTIIFRVSSFSSRSLLRSFSRRRRRCSTANSASVYVRSTLWRCCMPRVHPPRLGTLVNPWHRGKKNTVTWSKVTLPRRVFFAFFGMDVAIGGGKKMTLKFIAIKYSDTLF